MSAHLKEIYEAMQKNTSKDWDETIKKIKNQLKLRAFSCVQISNKICSNKNILKLTLIRDSLIQMGYKYSLESILNSELRVLKYLDYKLNITTPYTVIETMLEILGHNIENVQPEALFIVANRLLECFYYTREEIFDRLHESFTGRSKDKSDR